MNLKFGKREQIVVIGLCGLIAIGLLHFLVFSERAAKFREAASEVAALESQRREMVKIRSRPAFDTFKASTKKMETAYQDAITSLGVTKPVAFDLPASAVEIVLEPPPPRNATPERINQMKEAQFQAIRAEKLNQQIDMVFEEIDALRTFDPRTNSLGDTKMLFLAEGFPNDPNDPLRGHSGWNLPTELPPAIYSGGADVGRLKDTLGEIHQTKGIMKSIGQERLDLRGRQRAYYEQNLAQLGIDNNFYRNPAELPAKGPHVPLIHKLVFAMLIEDALKAGNVETIANDPVNRQRIFDWLEIVIPQEQLAPLRVNELYFMYEELRFLNKTLELARDSGIAEVFGVKFEEPGYLSEQLFPAKVGSPLPPRTAAPVDIKRGGVLEGDNPQPPINPPLDRDLGLCIPVVIQFHAQNLSAWNFIYAVFGEFPLVEIDEVNFVSASEAGDVYCQVRFLFIPYLFAADASVTPRAPAAAPGPAPRGPAGRKQPAPAAPGAGL